jgi:hypothetical protein
MTAEDLRTSEAATVLRVRERFRREAEIRKLSLAIELMARRYADAGVDFTLAHVTGNGDRADRFRRSSARRYSALQRLIAALAQLAADGAR